MIAQVCHKPEGIFGSCQTRMMARITGALISQGAGRSRRIDPLHSTPAVDAAIKAVSVKILEALPHL
jgi:hypothetical protein